MTENMELSTQSRDLPYLSGHSKPELTPTEVFATIFRQISQATSNPFRITKLNSQLTLTEELAGTCAVSVLCLNESSLSQVRSFRTYTVLVGTCGREDEDENSIA